MQQYFKTPFFIFKKWPDGDTEIIGSQSCSKIQSILFKEPTRKQNKERERNRNINRIPLKSYINPVRAHEREREPKFPITCSNDAYISIPRGIKCAGKGSYGVPSSLTSYVPEHRLIQDQRQGWRQSSSAQK